MDSSHYKNFIWLDGSIEVIDLSETITEASRGGYCEQVFEGAKDVACQNNNKRKKRKNKETKKDGTTQPTEVIDLSNDSDTTTVVSEQQNDIQDDEKCCPICLRSYKDLQIKATHCGHVFCSECIDVIVKQTKRCPLCRKKLTLKKLILLHL